MRKKVVFQDDCLVGWDDIGRPYLKPINNKRKKFLKTITYYNEDGTLLSTEDVSHKEFDLVSWEE